MRLEISFVFLLFIPLLLCQEDDDLNIIEPEIFDTNDIPVVEGDGGTIKTAIEEDVLILTKENFDLQIISKEFMLVEFYAPWCGHCQSLAPEYSKAAKILRHQTPAVHLAKVDATTETDLAARFDVSSYPTLFIFKKGEKSDYDGPRTAMGIVEYMNERADPNWKPPPESVITLTNENFADVVEKAEIILVEFYAPWCGHCKNLAPEYERAAKSLALAAKPIPLAKVDATAEKELADKYEAKGYPTLIIFRNGQRFPYEGPRDERGIVSYMTEQAKPASLIIDNVNVLASSLTRPDTSVVGFFDSEDSGYYAVYVEAANNLRGKFLFFHSFDKDIKKKYTVEEEGVVIFTPEIFQTEYEPKYFVHSNVQATVEELTEFLKESALPLVGERSPKTEWMYKNKLPIVIIFYDVDFGFDHRVQTQLIRKEVAKVAKNYKNRITFAVAQESLNDQELTSLGLDDSGEDVNVGFYDLKNVRYRMEPVEEFSASELGEFVGGVLAGKIPKHIKSQPIPKSNKGPVKTIVGRNFEELITESKKDVLIEFYAPWCGHCKKLEPIYKKLGKEFSDNDKILIAKIDATANDYPAEFTVQGFPTIYYIPAANKEKIITYNQERSLKDMKKFVNEQLSTDFVKDEL